MTRRAPAWLPFALALLWLAVGYANLARGTAWAGPRYRFTSFQHHAYSDVIALHGDRYLGGAHPLPYLEDRIEYPVLLGLALWLPSYAPGGVLGHLTATYLFLAACLAAALWALVRLPGARALWLGGTPALVYYAGLNWDLLPIALVALALLALERGRPGGAGGLAALGVSAKLFPAVLGPPALGAYLGGARARPALAFAVAGLAVLLAVNLPVALAAPEGWAWFFAFNAGRGAENSAWDALGIPRGVLLEALSAGPLALSALAGAAAGFAVARRGGDPRRAVRLSVALALVVWIATNKVWSPQYALYGFLAGALAAAPWPAFLALTAISAADFHAAFEVRARRWEEAFRDGVFHPVNLVRTAAWLLLAAWIARELWRAVRARHGGARPSGEG